MPLLLLLRNTATNGDSNSIAVAVLATTALRKQQHKCTCERKLNCHCICSRDSNKQTSADQLTNRKRQKRGVCRNKNCNFAALQSLFEYTKPMQMHSQSRTANASAKAKQKERKNEKRNGKKQRNDCATLAQRLQFSQALFCLFAVAVAVEVAFALCFWRLRYVCEQFVVLLLLTVCSFQFASLVSRLGSASRLVALPSGAKLQAQSSPKVG